MCCLFYHIPGMIKTRQSWRWNRCSISDIIVKYNRSIFFRWRHLCEVSTTQEQRKLNTWFVHISCLGLLFNFSFVYLHIVRLYIHIVYIGLSFEIRPTKGGYYLHVRFILPSCLIFIFSRARNCVVRPVVSNIDFLHKNDASRTLRNKGLNLLALKI
jgi:hypothetical protein